ncbi:hypothetical protein B0H11DRAFT_2065335 [Mycena galericulata]|nr:hypothetical protein B0H11DRAFT_2065335 [Mycena galericulata]
MAHPSDPSRGPIGQEKLPNEIWSEVFVCYPRHAPMALLDICHRWREIALGLPALWTNIEIEFPRARGFDQLLDVWLTRAGLMPTSISLRGSMRDAVPVVLAVERHAQHVRNLELYFMSGATLHKINDLFPSLKTLTIAQDDRNPDSPEYFASNPKGCIEMMRVAEGLLKCSFNGVYFKEDHTHHDPQPSRILSHSSLLHLHLGNGGHDGNSAAILQFLTLPALQTLYITDFDIPNNIFSDFLTRSSPPLQSLGMAYPFFGWPTETMHSDLRLIPDLTNFELVCTSRFVGEGLDFIEALATSPNFLPNLRNVTIHRCLPDREAYDHIVSALSARRATRPSQIQSFKLLWGWDGADLTVDADIAMALRTLVANGMHIHIGMEDRNLI